MKLAMVTPDRKMLVLIGLLAVLVLWVYYAYILAPPVQRVWQMGGEVRALRGQLRDVEQAIVQEPQLRQQHRQLAGEVEKLRTALPSEEELPAVIERLSGLASQTGVKLQLITPSPPASGPALYKEIPIDIEALAGFHQLGTFLDILERSDRFMRVERLRVARQDRGRPAAVQLVISTIYVPPVVPGFGQRAPER